MRSFGRKKWMLVVLVLVSVTALQATPIMVWDYKYDGAILPGVTNCVTNNAGNGIAAFTGSGAVSTATAKVYLGSGADAGTLFIDDLYGGGGNNILTLPGYSGGATTMHARMAMLAADNTKNVTPFYFDDGVKLHKWWIRTNNVYGSETVLLDMTVMREFWIMIPGDGTTGTMWVESADEPTGWVEVGSYDATKVTPRCLLGDISSSVDSKQQWDFIYWEVGTAVAVPEPATILILGFGFMTKLLVRRK